MNNCPATIIDELQKNGWVRPAGIGTYTSTLSDEEARVYRRFFRHPELHLNIITYCSTTAGNNNGNAGSATWLIHRYNLTALQSDVYRFLKPSDYDYKYCDKEAIKTWSQSKNPKKEKSFNVNVEAHLAGAAYAHLYPNADPVDILLSEDQGDFCNYVRSGQLMTRISSTTL